MGDRDRNVGRLDRILRIPFGVASAVVASWVFIVHPFEPRVVAFVVLPVALLAAILLISAITGTCGIYSVFGINTCDEESCTDYSNERWVAE